MERVVYIDEPAPDGTGYNEAPQKWRSITEEEFAKSLFFQYNPELIEDRAILQDDKPALMAKLFWFHDDTGIGMVNDFWGGKVQYFAFGCDHDYKELSAKECVKRGIYHGGQCYHVTECAKCKRINAVDSSD